MRPASRSRTAAGSSDWLSGTLLLLVLVSPGVTGLSAQSLVAHHFAHWLLVVAGAFLGYELRDRVQLPGRVAAAWLGLAATFVWHFPPGLAWTETNVAAHVFAHASLVAAGVAVGWAVPKLSGGTRAALFITANILMWPVVLAEMAGAFTYARYPGQEATAGVAEMAAMSSAWLILALWGPIRAILARQMVAQTLQLAMAGLLVLDWMAR